MLRKEAIQKLMICPCDIEVLSFDKNRGNKSEIVRLYNAKMIGNPHIDGQNLINVSAEGVKKRLIHTALMMKIDGQFIYG